METTNLTIPVTLELRVKIRRRAADQNKTSAAWVREWLEKITADLGSLPDTTRPAAEAKVNELTRRADNKSPRRIQQESSEVQNVTSS